MADGSSSDVELSRRKILRSSAGVATVGFTGKATANNAESRNKKHLGTSRVVEIGILYDGLPAIDPIFYDDVQDHIVERGQTNAITLVNKELPKATRETDLNPPKSQYENDITLKDLLLRSKPVIKTSEGYYGRRSIMYQRSRNNAPKELNDDNTVQRAINIDEAYSHPELDVTIQGKEVQVRSEGQESTIEPEETDTLKLESRSVNIKTYSDATKEVEDPRLEMENDTNATTRTVAKREMKEFEINPIVNINNLGRIDVYEQDGA